ncbi:YfhO family protein [Dyella sp.]|uniref:YfhO family protein n=1 Tax=Dyella sp. TaxID=1869338 RepID=UPI002B49A107|nr:YfhO family protein [Dyella sp.]HKT27822.1 YfhO family protein [Dyella sp.]
MHHFRRPSDAAYLLNFSLAIIAGIAVSRFKLQSRKEISILLLAAACWLAGASLNLRVESMRWQTFTLTASACAALALWRLQKPGTEWRTTLWLLAILIIDYRCFNLNGRFNQMRNTAQLFQDNQIVRLLTQKIHERQEALPPRIETRNTSVPWDNMVVFQNILSTQGYNPLRYTLYEQWYGARENSLVADRSTPFNPTMGGPISRLLGAKYLIIGHREVTSTPQPPDDYQRIFSDKDTELWSTDLSYSRLLNPTRAHLLAPGAAVDAPLFASSDFRNVLLLTPRDHEDARTASALVLTCNGQVNASVVSATPTQQHIRVQAKDNGWVVVSELDFPGWQAELDGKTIPIHRANGMFRAVCVPSGEHELRFRFHPWSMVAYAWQHAHGSPVL